MSLRPCPPLRFTTPCAIAAAFTMVIAAGDRAAAGIDPQAVADTVHLESSAPPDAAALDQLARQAVGADAASAIRELRAAGPAGLGALLETHRHELPRLWVPAPMPTDTPSGEPQTDPPTGAAHRPVATGLTGRVAGRIGTVRAAVEHAWRQEQSGQRTLGRLRHAIEQVAAQRDAHASGLFWHTDLASAKRAAAASQRPILSLRLLGRLDEELSCANSRLFRTTLYVDPGISQRLREDFVLHWESVRPVPRISIDFGDGHRIEQTITGNSAHYLLAADGTPLDVLPGLYAPADFTAWLDLGLHLARSLQAYDPEQRAAYLRYHHQHRLEQRLAAHRNADPDMLWRSWLGAGDTDPEPNAARAAALTMAKNFMEAGVLRHAGVLAPLPAESPAVLLEREGERRRAGVTLSPESRALIRSKQGAGHDADVIVRMIDQLEQSIAGDTALNEFVLRPRLRRWFIEGRIPADLGQLTNMLYAELFLTPLDDPWMGMANVEFWSALDHDGLTAPRATPEAPGDPVTARRVPDKAHQIPGQPAADHRGPDAASEIARGLWLGLPTAPR